MAGAERREKIEMGEARGAMTVSQVSAGAAAGVEDSRAGRNAAAEELVEEVDVDLAELFRDGESSIRHLSLRITG